MLILVAMQQFYNAATLEEIKKATGLNIELRTLQRRLEKLITEGDLKQTGIKRSARYYLAQTILQPSIIPLPNEKNSVVEITLSPESLDIINILSAPYEQRAIVGYNRFFLDNYQPNIDFYLSESEREQLAKDAFTNADTDQPAGTYAKHILQRLLIDLSWNSSRLEGNTYSLLDTERLLKEGAPAADKSATETQMILNHKEAIEFIVNGGEEI